MADPVSNLTDPLANVQQAQARQDNADLNQAVSQQQWSNTFVDTPPPQVLRDRLNFTSTLNRIIGNKMALAAQTDTHALDLMQKKAEFEEYQRQAPMREALLQAHTAAAGATERRKAAESQMQADHTANLNNGYVDLLQSTQPGTPEFAIGMAKLVADNPRADPRHVQELAKHFGATEDETPEQIIAKAVKMKELASASPLQNPRITPIGKGFTVREEGPQLTDEQKTAATIARNAAISAAKPRAPLTPNEAGFVGRYEAPVKALTEVQGILTKAGVDANAVWDTEAKDNNIGAALAAGKITQAEADKAAKAIDNFKRASGKKAGDYQAHFNEVAAKVNALKNPYAPATVTEGPSKVTTPDEYHALPSGAEFIDPQGVKRRKP